MELECFCKEPRGILQYLGPNERDLVFAAICFRGRPTFSSESLDKRAKIAYLSRQLTANNP